MKEKNYLDYDGLERLVYQIGNHFADWDTVDGKQDLLESGENIKTINNQSILGSGDVTITVPTKTSELTNNSNFVSDSSYVHTDNNYTTTEKNKLSGIASRSGGKCTV